MHHIYPKCYINKLAVKTNVRFAPSKQTYFSTAVSYMLDTINVMKGARSGVKKTSIKIRILA